MAETANPEPKNSPISPFHLTRREFLKLSWDLIKWGALSGAGIFFYELYKTSFADLAVATRCLAEPTNGYFENQQAESLKDHYDDALLVVHPGFGLLQYPQNYSGRADYQTYLTDLRDEIVRARENGQLVIYMIGGEDIRTGSALNGLGYRDSDYAVVTSSANPMPVGCIQTPDGKLLWQKYNAFDGILKAKGVKNIHIAGEFRSACVALAKNLISGNKFKIDVLDKAAYPPVAP